MPLSINTSNKHYALLIIYNVPRSEPVFLSLKLGPVGSRFSFLHHPEEMESISCVQTVSARATHRGSSLKVFLLLSYNMGSDF